MGDVEEHQVKEGEHHTNGDLLLDVNDKNEDYDPQLSDDENESAPSKKDSKQNGADEVHHEDVDDTAKNSHSNGTKIEADGADESGAVDEEEEEPFEIKKPVKPTTTTTTTTTPKKPNSISGTPTKTPTKTPTRTPTRPSDRRSAPSPNRTPTRPTPPRTPTSPAKSPSASPNRSFSPSISQHASNIQRSGNVFDTLYNDALQRREKQKQKKEQIEADQQKQRNSPSVSKLAEKTARDRDVFEALYADAQQRKENRKKREEGGQ